MMTPSPSVPVIFGQALRDFRRSAGAMIGYEVLIRLVSFAVIAPVICWILRTLVARSGRYAVGNTELLGFFLSPAGVITVGASAVLSLFWACLQLSGVILIADGESRGHPRSAIAAFWGVLRRMPQLLHLGILLVARLSLVAVPALAVIGLAYLALWSRFDLYFLTQTRPPTFWVGSGIAAVSASIALLIAARLALRWLVVLPVLLVEGRSAQDALRISANRTAGKSRRNLAILVCWGLGAAVLGMMASGLFGVLSDLSLARLPRTLSLTIPMLGLLLAVQFLLYQAVDLLSGLGLALVLFEVHRADAQPDPDPARATDLSLEDEPELSRNLGFRRKFLVAVLALLILASVSSLGILGTIGASPTITITAHRGGSRLAPENTRAAIRAAIAAGADSAEIDVQLSADGLVAVFHDEDLMRLAGDPRRLADLPMEELQGIDVGSWFGPEFREERIPTLDEILQEAGNRLALNIELKMIRGRSDPAPLVRGVLEALDRHRARGRCVISSLSYGALTEVRRQAPDLHVGFIIFEAVGDPTRLDLDFLSVREAIATDELIARARRQGWPVHVWTVNDPDRLASLVDRGVSDVLTSDPAVMVARRAELSELGDLDRLLLWYRRVLVDRPRFRLSGGGAPSAPVADATLQ
jgi:glycerophosphoryl diester phosphodiesterase